MNPWKQTIVFLLRDILRFALWVCVVLNGLMLAVFSIAFVYRLLTHTWGYLSRTIFSQPW